MFKKILIANRGEIAVRVIRTCRDMGIRTVAVYSDIDRTSLHTRMADEAYLLGPAPATESYLKGDRILEIAKSSGAEAIHPGYGFLSENASFARKLRDAGIAFIGPTPEAIEKLGDKISSRKVAIKAGVPTIPGAGRPLEGAADARKIADEIGYPVMLKASAGGGGKGMRLVTNKKDIESAFELAASEAKSYFADSKIFVEKYIGNPHHIEVQILADIHGNITTLGERDCSIQRRHQKVLEESPSPFIGEKTRRALVDAATRLARDGGYTSAGTMEFLVDSDQNFYFLEANTRLQVEHPVTELTTGIDLVKAQIQIAAGETLEKIVGAAKVQVTGHALECRIYAEDPERGFIPSPGTIEAVRNPEGPGVRIDSAIFPGAEISIYYDPMIAKLVTWGRTREEAISRMRRALAEYRIEGVKNTIAFHEAVLDHEDFIAGRFDTGFIERMGNLKSAGFPLQNIALIAAAIAYQDLKSEKQENISRGKACLAPTANWKLTGRREGTNREA